MLIPWNTDAPINHWPYATVGLIVVNVGAFMAMLGAADETVAEWILWHGEGLHPLQWITSNFMHDGLMHLVGNMVFLWGFGLVIEGKLGWLRFLAVFLGLGIVQCALEQVCSLGMEPSGSLGASAVLFGLMGMALVWAPKNEMSCLLLLGFRVVTLELSILVFASLYLAWQLVMFGIEVFGFGEPLGAAALHLMGAVLGLVMGVAMLKLKWVDCENWDVFALWNDRLGEGPRKRRKKATVKEVPSDAVDPAEESQRRAEQQANRERQEQLLANMLAAGNVDASRALVQRLRESTPDWELSEQTLLAWVKLLHARRLWEESLPWMVSYLRRWPEKSARMRLRLAQLLVEELKRPGQALHVLAKLPSNPLPASFEEARSELVRQATQMQDESASFEVGLEDW